MIAKADLEERYPERKILIVDSLGASSGYGLLMDRLADLRDEGKTLEEVYEPFLIKEGFIKRTPRGREVTELAYTHLGRLRPDGIQSSLF